ncbi:hypothetical protein [Oscillatoria sp. FACHB-1407]|uniref:hypothetical protein n=1 Tax=Oscillatoria sp. FACHB-1407 TaxID=2692847 RepID=UPI0030D756EF
MVVEFLSPGTEADDLGRFYDESMGRSPSDLTPSTSDTTATSRSQSCGNWHGTRTGRRIAGTVSRRGAIALENTHALLIATCLTVLHSRHPDGF